MCAYADAYMRVYAYAQNSLTCVSMSDHTYIIRMCLSVITPHAYIHLGMCTFPRICMLNPHLFVLICVYIYLLIDLTIKYKMMWHNLLQVNTTEWLATHYNTSLEVIAFVAFTFTTQTAIH